MQQFRRLRQAPAPNEADQGKDLQAHLANVAGKDGDAVLRGEQPQANVTPPPADPQQPATPPAVVTPPADAAPQPNDAANVQPPVTTPALLTPPPLTPPAASIAPPEVIPVELPPMNAEVTPPPALLISKTMKV